MARGETINYAASRNCGITRQRLAPSRLSGTLSSPTLPPAQTHTIHTRTPPFHRAQWAQRRKTFFRRSERYLKSVPRRRRVLRHWRLCRKIARCKFDGTICAVFDLFENVGRLTSRTIPVVAGFSVISKNIRSVEHRNAVLLYRLRVERLCYVPPNKYGNQIPNNRR